MTFPDALQMGRRPEERMLRWAIHEIAHNGEHAAEIREIAKLAKTSTSRFHEFFRCRDELLAAVFDRGWQIIERRISERVLACLPTQDVVNIAIGVVEAVLDSMEDEKERDSVSAAIVLGLTCLGQPVFKQLKEAPAYQRYRKISGQLRAALSKFIPQDEAEEALELIFGAIVRRLLMLTPLFRKDKPFDRAVFLRVVRNMIQGVLNQGGQAMNL